MTLNVNRAQAIGVNPTNHIYFSNRAMSYIALKMWAEAERDGLETIRLDKTFLKGYHRTANAQINLGKYLEAEATLETGLKYNSNDDNLLSLMRDVKGKAEAIREKEKKKMSTPELLKTEGNELFKQGKFVEAIDKVRYSLID